MADVSWGRIATRARVPLGFLFAAAYLWFAKPDWPWMAAGSAFIVAGIAVRAAASGHIRKNRELTTTGPYAYTRNPLYLGSIVIATGFVLAARNWWIGVALVLMFAFIYWPVIRDEEKYLRATFPGYEQYAASVPRFLPRLYAYRADSSPGAGYSLDLYLRHREYNSIVGSLLMMGALILKMLLVRH